jgi:hypothetical protein
VVRAHSEPIRNPVTDREEQMILVLPKGWVFHEAENASGFAKGFGAIKFDLNGPPQLAGRTSPGTRTACSTLTMSTS